jgi:hypothetical protein
MQGVKKLQLDDQQSDRSHLTYCRMSGNGVSREVT